MAQTPDQPGDEPAPADGRPDAPEKPEPEPEPVLVDRRRPVAPTGSRPVTAPMIGEVRVIGGRRSTDRSDPSALSASTAPEPDQPEPTATSAVARFDAQRSQPEPRQDIEPAQPPSPRVSPLAPPWTPGPQPAASTIQPTAIAEPTAPIAPSEPAVAAVPALLLAPTSLTEPTATTSPACVLVESGRAGAASAPPGTGESGQPPPDPNGRADVDAEGNWIPPLLRGVAPDASAAAASLPQRRRTG